MEPFEIVSSRRGRLSRTSFGFASLAAFCMFVMGLFVMSMTTVAGLIMTIVTFGLALPAMFLIGLAWAFLICGYAWIQINMTSKRLHDMGMPGWHALWAVPIVMVGTAHTGPLTLLSLIVIAWLVLAPGQSGPNRYGLQPA